MLLHWARRCPLSILRVPERPGQACHEPQRAGAGHLLAGELVPQLLEISVPLRVERGEAFGRRREQSQSKAPRKTHYGKLGGSLAGSPLVGAAHYRLAREMFVPGKSQRAFEPIRRGEVFGILHPARCPRVLGQMPRAVEPHVVDGQIKAHIAQQPHHAPDMVSVDVGDDEELKVAAGQLLEPRSKPCGGSRRPAVDQDMMRFAGASGGKQEAVAPFRWKDLKHSRTAARCSRAFLRPKSAKLFEQTSLRKKVQNFSYCLTNACFQ
jgi:hypothetical protein